MALGPPESSWIRPPVSGQTRRAERQSLRQVADRFSLQKPGTPALTVSVIFDHRTATPPACADATSTRGALTALARGGPPDIHTSRTRARLIVRIRSVCALGCTQPSPS